MKTVNVKCPVCKQRGRLSPDDLVAEHQCPNCRQIVRLIPENDTSRRVKFWISLIVVSVVIWWAISHIWDKYNY